MALYPLLSETVLEGAVENRQLLATVAEILNGAEEEPAYTMPDPM